MKMEVQDLIVGHEPGKPVLEHVSFDLEDGDICAVLGPNGVGKSTLFSSLIGLQAPLGGRVILDKGDMRHWTPKRLAKVMAYVPQNTDMAFPHKVFDVVMMGRLGKLGNTHQPTDDDYNIVENALNDMGIFDLRDCLCTDISGGERQLMLIARALTQRPKIILLDEPTAALDYGNAMRVIARLRDLANRGYIVIMTTHMPNHAFLCDSKVLLLQREFPARFGAAGDIITQRNMKQAYGVNIRIVEFVDSRGKVMRLCSPDR